MYGRLRGYGATCGAYHRVRVDEEGEESVRAIELALEDAGLAAEEIGYASLHGTSTVLSDKVETRIIQAVFKQSRPAVGDGSGQILHRPSAGSERRRQSRRDALVRRRRFCPSDPESSESRPRLRPGLCRRGPAALHVDFCLVQLAQLRLQVRRSDRGEGLKCRLISRGAPPSWNGWTITNSSPRELRGLMGFLSFANNHFGGCRAILNVLNRWENRWQKGDTIHFLDVGTGGADVPLAIYHWANSRSYRVSITGIDKAPEIADFARKKVREIGDITIVHADVFDWAAAGHSYDYVIGSLFLHHIPDVQIPGMLRCWDRMARRGLIVSDLVRSPWAYAGVSLLLWIAGNPIVQNDGPLSVRRAFSRDDLERYRNLAVLPYLEVRHHLGFRWTLAGEKGNFIKARAAAPAVEVAKENEAFNPGISSRGRPCEK